ncbi:hypothetical protein ALQ16_204396 [Pseudomonas syringae pv. actinidiae]|nr:hypothetical protein ALQ16_204396 [Pseudomonas syringae pv. actinidiae]
MAFQEKSTLHGLCPIHGASLQHVHTAEQIQGIRLFKRINGFQEERLGSLQLARRDQVIDVFDEQLFAALLALYREHWRCAMFFEVEDQFKPALDIIR